jgi:hypothetical protein
MDSKEIGILEWKRKMLIMLLIFILIFCFVFIFLVYFFILYFYRLDDGFGAFAITFLMFIFLPVILGIIINIYISLFYRQIQDFLERYLYNRYGFLYSKQSNEIRIEIESIPLVNFMRQKYFELLHLLEFLRKIY